MKYITVIILTLLSLSGSQAQSSIRLDPETRVAAADSTERPIIQLEVTINSIRLLKIKADSTVARDFTFKKGSTLSITCVSDLTESGAQEIFTKFNNEPEKRYREPIRFIARGRHTLVVRAKSPAGGESSLKISFTVIE